MSDLGRIRKLTFRLYQLLLYLYPSGFREEYAKAMEREARDELGEVHSRSGLLRVFLLFVRDLATTIPIQIATELRQDCRHAFRDWARRPWHTGFAVSVLGIAIGANTGVFSVVNAAMLRSLPFVDSRRLVALIHFQPPHDTQASFDQWRTHTTYLQDAALYETGDFNVGTSQHMDRMHLAVTSSNFFTLLGAKPLLGRTFAANDRATAVISYSMWQALYGGSEHVIGKTIQLHGLQPHPEESLFIVGVMPREFAYPAETMLWKTADYGAANNGWDVLGRLRAGISLRQARQAFVSDVRRLEPQRRVRADWLPILNSMQDALAGPVRKASLLLMGLVMFILLIACANLANLLLARMTDRRQELSIRSALGASRARLLQQIFTECLFLAGLAISLGVPIAFWVASLATKVQGGSLSLLQASVLDYRVLLFALALAIASAICFGFLPALNVVAKNHVFAARGTVELPSARFVRQALVGSQIALTIVLLGASFSLIRALFQQLQIDRGWQAAGVVSVSVALDGTSRKTAPAKLAYFDEVLSRLRNSPQVVKASAAEFLPLVSSRFTGGPYAFDGQRSQPGTGTDVLPVMSDYFYATGGKVLYGREFNDEEIRVGAPVVAVNETLARKWLHPSKAVGHTLTDPDGVIRRIVGVVRNLDFMGQYFADVFDVDPPEIFIPAQEPGGFDSTFVVKVKGEAREQLAAVRAIIQGVDRGVPLYRVETMQARVDAAFARPKFYRTVLLFFAGFALSLALSGTYAVVSYAVAQRTHEMGVRLALGTTPSRLRGRFIQQGMITVLCGLLAGIAGAAVIGPLFSFLIEGAKTPDISTFTVAAFAICLVAAFSIWVGTRGIARMDINEILRAE